MLGAAAKWAYQRFRGVVHEEKPSKKAQSNGAVEHIVARNKSQASTGTAQDLAETRGDVRILKRLRRIEDGHDDKKFNVSKRCSEHAPPVPVEISSPRQYPKTPPQGNAKLVTLNDRERV